MFSSVSVFATSPDNTYFKSNSSYNWTGASGTHQLSSGTKLADLVAKGINYISLDLAAINTHIGSLYTLTNNGLSTISTNTANIADIELILNSLQNGWYSANSSLNPPSSHSNSWYYRVLQALGDLQTSFDDDGIIYQLSQINNELSYWSNAHGRNYGISEMVYSIMDDNNNVADIIEQVLSGGAITSDWHWNDNGVWRAVGANNIPVINRNSDGQLYLNVYPYEASDLSIKGLLQAMIRNQFYETTAIRGTYENNMFSEYTSSGAINPQPVDNVIKGLSKINNNTASGFADIVSYFKPYTSKVFRYIQQTGIEATATIQNTSTNTPFIQYNTNLQRSIETANPVNIYEFLDVINKNMTMGVNSIFTPRGDYRDYTYNSSTNTVVASSNVDGPFSVMDYLARIQQRSELYLGKMQFVLADDDTIQAKQANANQTDAVLDGFTGSGDASASASDFGDIKDSVGSVKAGLNTNVSVSNIFNIFNNNDGYGFWSDDTRNELNSTGSNRNNLKARGVSDTPLYDAKINELYNAMGVKYE